MRWTIPKLPRGVKPIFPLLIPKKCNRCECMILWERMWEFHSPFAGFTLRLCLECDPDGSLAANWFKERGAR